MAFGVVIASVVNLFLGAKRCLHVARSLGVPAISVVSNRDYAARI